MIRRCRLRHSAAMRASRQEATEAYFVDLCLCIDECCEYLSVALEIPK